MKKVLFIILFIVVAGKIFAQDSGELPVPLTDPAKRGKLIVDIHYGGVIVKGTSRKDVLVKYAASEDKPVGSNERNGLKKISSGTIGLEASENDNVVKVESSSWNKKTNVIVEVPIGFDVKASSYNDGDIVINNIEGEVEITTYNGEVTAENISGSVIASTYNGEVKISFNKVKEGVPMSFSTYNGDIDLTLPSAVKATLKMKTEQGEILSGFDMTVLKSNPIQKKDTGSGTYKVIIDEWVKGDINGGGPEISMRNYNGDILIRKK